MPLICKVHALQVIPIVQTDMTSAEHSFLTKQMSCCSPVELSWQKSCLHLPLSFKFWRLGLDPSAEVMSIQAKPMTSRAWNLEVKGLAVLKATAFRLRWLTWTRELKLDEESDRPGPLRQVAMAIVLD